MTPSAQRRKIMNPFNADERMKELQALDDETNYGKNDLNFIDRYIENNTIDIDQDQTVYRVLSYPRLLEVIRSNSLSLSRPSTWKDPYENFILNAIGELKDGTRVNLSDIRDSYYAQCWTEREECDGLWRNFKSKKTPSVRIKTKIKKLMNEFYDITNIFHSLSYFCGKVTYYPEKEIVELFDDEIDFSVITGQSLFFEHGLLIKREQFSYENEIRLIFRKPNSPTIDLKKIKNKWDNSDYFNYSIDINNVIEEITIEPWVTDADFVTMEKEIYSLGYTGNINKSNLYERPLFILKM